jgi:predicted deacetylase
MELPGNPIWTRFYVPEIHDVHPGMEAEFDAMLGVMPAAARDVAALLVVPDWQGRAPIGEARSLLSRLAALPGEKVLHGWTHSLGPDFLNWLLYGHDNRSEFARLDGRQAAERIARGVESFASLGVRPRWFCAPRWQQSAAARAALGQAGFEAFMLGGSLETFSGVSAPIPALNFDEGERRLRNRIMHALREGRIGRLLSAGRPFRVALHPADVRDAIAWDQIERLFARLGGEGWEPVSPDAAVERWRAVSTQGRAAA